MPKLIFDIETIGVQFDGLDRVTQDFLLAECENDEERDLVKEQLGFSPLTGQIVAIGVLNPDSSKGAVFYHTLNDEIESQDKDVRYAPCKDEKEVIKNFWDISSHYDQFVTFNGHTFDCPFLMIRSAVLKIKPTKNLLRNRYRQDLHCDILDSLTNFGAARWKKSLHMWCNAFGIKSPKGDGISGDQVARLFKEKKCLDIARYCFNDVKATAALYDYWEKYLK